MDEGDIIVQLEKLPSITLDKSIDLDLRVQKAILAQVPEVDRIVARVGSDEIGMDPMGLNETDVFMVLRPQSEWRMDSKEELIEEIRVVLDKFPGIAYGFTQPIEMRVSEMLTGVRGDVAVKLFGPELDLLNQYAAEIADVLRTVPGSEDVFASQNDGVQYYELDIDRLAAGRLGMDVLSIQRILRTQLEGLPLGIVQEGSRRTPLLMRADATVGASPATFSTMPIALAGGISVPLSSLAKIRHVEGVVAVARERGQRYTVVRTNVAGRDLVGFVEEARSAVSSAIDLPAGYYVEWGGQFENHRLGAASLTGPDEYSVRVDRRCLRTMADRRVSVSAGVRWLYCITGHRRTKRRCNGLLFQPAESPRTVDV